MLSSFEVIIQKIVPAMLSMCMFAMIKITFISKKELLHLAFIDPSTQSRKDNYKLLSGSVIPRPIAFVTSQNEQGVLNGAPFSFFNVLTAEPPLISISVGRRNGETTKDTGKNILLNKEFVVHIVDESIIEHVNKSAAEYPSDVSEIVETGLTPVDSKKISVPGVKEAKIRMECELFQAIPLGTDEEYTTDLLIGKVVMIYVDDEVYENGKINAKSLNPVARLAGADYAKLGNGFSLTRPK